jgi:hypothetical protein
MTKHNRDAVYKAYAELEAAAEAFYTAVGQFQKVYDPRNTGMGELCEHINEVLADVDAELDEEL